MRMILGLDHPSGGEALIDGRPYASMRHPVREVGALLDAKALHPARSARGHLVAQARSNGIPVRRVDEVLEMVGLAKVARRSAGAFSLGMYQRLGVAGALLGDPRVLVFDEPVNGLDPDGVRWVRELVRSLAAEGRTVFLSSHLMSEMQLTADRLVIIGRGSSWPTPRWPTCWPASSLSSVRVRTPDAADLRTLTGHLLKDGAVSVESPAADELVVKGRSAEQVGDLAHRLGLRLHELRTVSASLEQVYMELTARSVEYETGDTVFGGTGTGQTRGAGA